MKKRGSKIIITIAAIVIFLPVFFITSVYAGLFGHLPGKEEIINYKNSSATVVLSSDGDLIGKFFSENRTSIGYEEIPAYLIKALIATEDARFYEHSGIDSRSFFRVFFKTILSRDRSSGGGSTITQQLAKNMYGRRDYPVISLVINKTREALLAHRIEKVLSKEEILTLYLNTVSFGENLYGIEAASLRYFNKKTSDLRIEEAAVLTGLLKANTSLNPRLHPADATARRNVVLNQMVKYGYLDKEAADSVCTLPLQIEYNRTDIEGEADYFMIRVRSEAERILADLPSLRGSDPDIERDGLTIITTLRMPLQKAANEAFNAHLPVMQKRLDEQYSTPSGKRALKEIPDSLKKIMTTLHAGLLAVDPVSGAIRSWVGGIDYRTNPYDQILARRQLASVFKPVIFAAAIEDGLEPCHYLDNDSVILSGFKDWSPENYDHSYGGKYSICGALVHSMNIPTFSLYMLIGFDKVDRQWKKMGFSFPLDNTPSLAMGTAEASIMEVARAYSSFANGGMKITPYCIESITDHEGHLLWQHEFVPPDERVLSERTSMLMSAMLQRAISDGTGASVYSVYDVKIPLAGKTGTSQNYADAWFAAFNPGLVIVSRAGASTPSIHFHSGRYGSGSTLALPLVALTLKKAEKDPGMKQQLNIPFPPLPPELEAAMLCPDFREKTFFDRLMDLFNDDEVLFEEAGKRRRSILRRIFRR
jgi:penicillin-binding protein 1A